jgi:hypothetical protein
MTPQEQRLVDDLFDRLATLETNPRDPDAERRVAAGLTRAPHAVYALVQTTLLQDEALKRASERIEELQAMLAPQEQPGQQGSFLDSMRDAVFGRPPERTSSVPTIRQQSAAPPAAAPFTGAQPQMPYPPAPSYGSGGSFLGTAASAAAGVIGGSLLLDGIRSMFGHRHFGSEQSVFDRPAEERHSPWSDTSAERGDRQDADFRDNGIELADDNDTDFDDGSGGGGDSDYA